MTCAQVGPKGCNPAKRSAEIDKLLVQPRRRLRFVPPTKYGAPPSGGAPFFIGEPKRTDQRR